jgi:hypothetical protein
METNHYAT